MSKVISQATVIQAASAKVNGSADSILKAAVGLFTAGNGLAAQVRALFASPAPVVEATLVAVFQQLEGRLPKSLKADEKPAAWASIANSVATNVRIQWNKLPADARPGVCYIALDRGALTANVIVLQSPTKKEVGQALALDVKAKNAAIERLFPSKPAAQKPADQPAVTIGQPDKHAPRADAVGTIMEQLVPFSTADLHELAKRIGAEIDRRTAAALEKAEAKGRGPSAAGKPNAKARGESQKKAKEKAVALAG